MIVSLLIVSKLVAKTKTLLENVAAAGGAAGADAGGGAAPAASTAAHYGGDHMDIERAESSMKKFLSENSRARSAAIVSRRASTRGSAAPPEALPALQPLLNDVVFRPPKS